MSDSSRPSNRVLPDSRETLVFGSGNPLLPVTLDLPDADSNTPAFPPPTARVTLDLPPNADSKTPAFPPPTAGVTLVLPANAPVNGEGLSFSVDPMATASYVPAEPGLTETYHSRIGRFELRQKLGEGAFGEVYQAYDPQLDREVALKLAKPGAISTPQRLERFFREAKASGNLRHPNIVPLFEAGQQDGRCYIASAFIAGKTLEAVIEKHNDRSEPMPVAETARIMRKVAEAMAYAHSQGIVHRDVKPQNMMMDEKGEPLLLDFGLASRAEAGDEKLTQEGTAMGTPAYMAPEQIDGNGIAASDQYSLGCTLYQMLTGRTPFAGGPTQQMFLHQNEPVPHPRKLRSDIPRDLETICLKTLEKDPRQRYAGCAELAEDLRRFAAAEPILARSVGLFERGVKWARRRPRDAALAVAVLLIICVGCLGAGIYGLYAEQQTRVFKQQSERRRQADAFWLKGRESESEGRQALTRNDQASAIRLLTEADGSMEQALAVLAASREPEDETLRAEIETRLEGVRKQSREVASDQSERRDVQSWIAKLGRDRDELLFRHLSVDSDGQADNREAIAKLAPASLASFRIDPSRPGESSKQPLKEFARHFQSEAQLRQTARWCCEALFVWAEAEADSAKEAGRRQAVRLLNMAQIVAESNQVPVPNVLYQRRAGLLAVLGDNKGAKADQVKVANRPPVSALDHFLLAVDSYRQGRTGEAIHGCEEAVRLEPGYFWPPYLQGLCHLRQRQWALADAWLTTCVTQRPDFVWPRVLRAGARVELRNLDGAESDLKSVEGDKVEQAARYLGLMTRSRLAAVRERWEDARDALKLAIAARPEGGYQAHANLAQVYRQLGDTKAALGELDLAIIAQPKDGQLYYTRAQIRREAEDIAGARQDFVKAVESGGQTGDRWLASAHVELGYLKHLAGDREEALAEYNAALKVVDGYAPAYRQRAETLLSMGKHAEAGRALDECIAHTKTPDAETYRARGLIHATLKEYSKAALAYSQSLQLKNDPQVLNYRGWAYLQAQSVPLALADFEAVLKAKPEHSDALCGRAQILALTGKVSEAVADAEKALKHGGKPTTTLLCNLACVYVRAARLGPANGDATTALLYQERGAELLMRAAEMVPANGRSKFWREQVEKDVTLRELLKNADVARLARTQGW
ncbi:serine/threonine-protein kinase [Zavarzinella formosa]|uniref:serine/threonine-protein kinase n=1 Tax=Zavarzinella formosa TaxID=360055 RepID=UPI0002FE5BA3|nr:serine/threonine-protein kinase [Zavarzinella formosa]